MISLIALEVKPLGLVATAGCKTLELEPPSPRPRYLDWTMSQSPAAWPGTVLHPHCPEAGPCFARLVRLVGFQR
jgi:hypothetical protein